MWAVVCLWREALATRRSAVAPVRWRKRRKPNSDCKMACLHRAATAWQCRTSLRTLSARCFFAHKVARNGGQSASWSKTRSIRPYREPKGGLTVLVLIEAQCRELVHDFKRSSPGQRRGYPCLMVAVRPSGGGPWVRQRFQAHRARGAVDGVEPLFLACFGARRRRALTMLSGRRYATRRQATRSLAPRTSGGSVLSPATGVRQETRASGCPGPAAGCKRGVCGWRRLKKSAPAVARRAQALI
jgi:hypothetical protein